MGSDADHPNSLGLRLSRTCLISKICGAAWNYDHDPAWNDPTARRATFDNRQANLMRGSCWHDNLACIIQTCHERLCGTKTSTFEHRTFSRKSWNAHRIFIPQGDVTCGVNISHLHGPRRATPQIHHRPRAYAAPMIGIANAAITLIIALLMTGSPVSLRPARKRLRPAHVAAV